MEVLPKPQMKFKAIAKGNEAVIYPACPHSIAWFESMNKRTIKPSELKWVGEMGIELSFVTGNVKAIQNEIGKDKISNSGILRGKFDMLENLKK